MGLHAYQLLRKGGRFLGAARSWIQWHKNNGSDVTWGSTDVLQPPMTVREVEELASQTAAAHADDVLAEYEHALNLALRAINIALQQPQNTADETWTLKLARARIEEVLGKNLISEDQP